MEFRVPWTYIHEQIMEQSGTKHSNELEFFVTFSFVDPALDEESKTDENVESCNDVKYFL